MSPLAEQAVWILVMTAILAMQAFLFQDGGILALGTNICNMAMVGVFAGYLPYYLWGRGSSKAGRSAAGARPDISGSRSDWLGSPVTTMVEFQPSRVSSIFSWP